MRARPHSRTRQSNFDCFDISNSSRKGKWHLTDGGFLSVSAQIRARLSSAVSCRIPRHTHRSRHSHSACCHQNPGTSNITESCFQKLKLARAQAQASEGGRDPPSPSLPCQSSIRIQAPAPGEITAATVIEASTKFLNSDSKFSIPVPISVLNSFSYQKRRSPVSP